MHLRHVLILHCQSGIMFHRLCVHISLCPFSAQCVCLSCRPVHTIVAGFSRKPPVSECIWLLQAQPFLSYGVLIVNLAVYMAGLGVRFSLGESSGESYFYGLAKVNDEVVQGEYYRCVFCALFACCCHPFPARCRPHRDVCLVLLYVKQHHSLHL